MMLGGMDGKEYGALHAAAAAAGYAMDTGESAQLILQPLFIVSLLTPLKNYTCIM